jgi:hypothetical protein
MQDVEQLQRDHEEAIAELTPDARRVWIAIEEDMERADRGEEVPAEMPPEYEDLHPSEQGALVRVVKLSARVYEAEEAEAEGMKSLLNQAIAIFRRAQELEPSIGEGTTLSEAVAVLQRHGVNPGLSPEVSEMVIEVPTEE